MGSHLHSALPLSTFYQPGGREEEKELASRHPGHTALPSTYLAEKKGHGHPPAHSGLGL